MPALSFRIVAGCRNSRARLGQASTPHGSFDTPSFMPVGTRAAVKGLLPAMVRDLGAQVILANTYHLMLRPGSELIAAMGGLHRWMRWAGPILTDSGGYQVFSLARLGTVSDEGVRFRSHVDGAELELTPARSIQAQNELGADIIMALDDCPPAAAAPGAAPGPPGLPGVPGVPGVPGLPGVPGVAAGAGPAFERTKQACERSVRWLDQCVRANRRAADQALFGIVQGGTDLGQRRWCLERVCAHGLPGYAIGGVAVGEGHAGLKQVVEHTAPLLPADRPRYLMGVGYERDILVAVRAGVDMFDCVLPTRNGRNAVAFTPAGPIRLRNARFARDQGPLDAGCDCPACAGGFGRSYLRHLFQVGEMLGPILLSAHNIRHFQRFLLDIRRAIADNDWPSIRLRWPVLGSG